MDNLQNFHRTNYCGELRLSDAGKTVSVCGWVQRQRDLGGLIFVDLRDRTGLVQLSFDDSTDKAIFEKASTLRSEYVIAATGLVRERESKTNKIATGDIEIYVSELRLLAKAETPPFEIVENSKANDMLRLKYRYLDLRRPDMQHAIATRHKVTKICRDYFDEQGFLEIETPMLTKSTPEGARDYLVPSRVHPGKFYALPQSPQQYKQLLMLSGFDRYMQIARCFRDEDLRADRQPDIQPIGRKSVLFQQRAEPHPQRKRGQAAQYRMPGLPRSGADERPDNGQHRHAERQHPAARCGLHAPEQQREHEIQNQDNAQKPLTDFVESDRHGR